MSWFAAEYQRARLGVKFFKSPESPYGVLLQVIVFSLLNQLPRVSSSQRDHCPSAWLLADRQRVRRLHSQRRPHSRPRPHDCKRYRAQAQHQHRSPPPLPPPSILSPTLTSRLLFTLFIPVPLSPHQQVFEASSSLAASLLPLASSTPSSLARFLTPDLFNFRKSVGDQLSENLFPHMPSILCSPQPMLEAAKVNSVAEFERLYRVVRRQDVFRNRNVLIVAGLNVDLMRGYHPFPGCLFVPWAA